MRKRSNLNGDRPNTALVVFVLMILVTFACLINVKLTNHFDFMNEYQEPFYEKISKEELKLYTYEDIQENKDVINNLEKQLQDMIVSGNAREDEIANMAIYVERLKKGEVSVNINHMLSAVIDSNIKRVVAEIDDKRVDEHIIRAIMKQESNFNPTVVSKSGAMGLMQLMPQTAQWLKIENPFDIYENIRGGALFYRDRLNEFGSMHVALAAYNAGQGTVKTWLKDKRYSADGRTLKYIPYEETRHYVPVVIRNYNVFKAGGK
jgi:soluble lytic murein transglycosylase